MKYPLTLIATLLLTALVELQALATKNSRLLRLKKCAMP